MKQETKRKLVNWFAKFIRYDETKICPFIIEQRELQKVTSHHIYDNETLCWLKDNNNQHEFEQATEMAKMLVDRKAIKFIEEPFEQSMHNPPKTRVFATLMFLMP